VQLRSENLNKGDLMGGGDRALLVGEDMDWVRLP
jgi:hypothetical protein